MSKRFPCAAAFAALLLLSPALAAAAPLSLAQAMDLALRRSESVRGARAGATSAGESAIAAGQLPDPVLRAGIDNLPATGADRFRTTRDAMTMKRIGISQEWLSAEKRDIRTRAARAMAEREQVQVLAAEARTRRQVADAYVDAWHAASALQLAELSEHHSLEALAAARARLAGGGGDSAELLQLAAAQGSAADERAQARQQQASALLGLRRWIGFEPDALDPPASLPIPAEQDFVVRSPAVAALQRDVVVARENAEVAAQERKPNWTWELSYGQRTGYSDMVSVNVSIPLRVAPSLRQDREAAARLALVDKAEADLAEAVRSAQADYRALASDVERLQQRIDRYQADVVAPAGQRTAAATAAYRSNRAPLSALFEARHAEVEARRRLLGLRRDLAKTQASLAFQLLAEGGAP